MADPSLVPPAPSPSDSNVGTQDDPFKDINITGAINDTSGATVTPAEAEAAYDHSVVVSGNPHSVTAVEVGADATGTAAAAVTAHETTYDHTKIADAEKFQGVNVATTAPSDGQAQVYNSSTLQYEPKDFSGLSSVSSDTTLTGTGTAGDPLSVADDNHDHVLSNIDDAGTAAAYDVPGLGDASATEVVKGDDTRLSDDRDPTAHATEHELGGTDPVDHDALTNFVANEHVDHSSVSIVDSSDITGGGDLTASRTLTLTATGVTAGVYTLMGANVDAKGRIVSASSATNIESLQFDPAITAPSHSEGLIFYDKDNHTFGIYNDESDVTLQVGQEIWVRVYNDSGATISNGEVAYLSGVQSGFPTVALADASDADKCLATLGFATHDIGNNSYGYITRIGTVRDIDTSGCTPGDSLFLSATTPGAFTTTAPQSPNYRINLGNCGVSSATVGTVEVQINIGNNVGGTVAVFNGSILEDHVTTVTSNGTVITLSIEQTGGGDLSLFFNGGFTAFDSTPAATVALTAGTDPVPVLNYVYIPQSTNTLTANTTGFPWASQIVPVATVLCQSAATLQTDGALKHHAWTDHVTSSNGQGHITHVNRWIRSQNATWLTGSQITATGGANTFDVSTTSGTMLQLHEHATDAFDTSTGDSLYIVNDPTTAYLKVGDLTQQMQDSAGGSLSGRYYSLVFWIAGNEATGNDKLYCTLPAGSYNSQSGASEDLLGYTNYSIPSSFKGVGILIARVNVRNQSGAGGTFTINETVDLRGLVPSTAAGGATGGGGAENFTDLLDVPSSYSGEAGNIVAVNSGETALEFIAPTGVKTFTVMCSDQGTDITTGTAKMTFRMPYAMTLTGIRAFCNTAPVGATITIDVNESGTTILSTKLTIDAGEKTSETAATPPVISDSALADDAEITIDFDQVGSTTAGKGVGVIFEG